jgi:hypothetical protein
VKGSLQEYLDGYLEAKKVPLPKGDENYEEFKNMFQIFAILDYCFGNQDRHNENWLLKIEDGKITKIAMIDNGNSFPLWNNV